MVTWSLADWNPSFAVSSNTRSVLLATVGQQSTAIFVTLAAVIISYYGGGFATVPAYLKDLFGTLEVGAIHGRLLTAWAAAGVVGPLIVNGFLDAAGEGQLIEARGEVTRAGGKTVYVRGIVAADAQPVLSFTGIIRKITRR